MKKIFLTAIALLTMASVQVFGMYKPVANQWIGFLTDRYQLRARGDQFGFTLGNDTIRGTFGFANSGGAWLNLDYADKIGDVSQDGFRFRYDFKPTISMGLGYTSSPFSIGFGYSATISGRYNKYNGKETYKKADAVAHTPVLTLNAMDNAFRMAIPIQVVHLTDKAANGDKGSVTAVSVDAQFRYYTGLDALSQVRLLLRYGNFGYNLTNAKGKFAESFGFTFRVQFLKTTIEEVNIEPFIQVDYNTALGKQNNSRNFIAVENLNVAAGLPNFILPKTNPSYGVGAWDFSLMPGLFLFAGNDVVYFELTPSLGLKIVQPGHSSQKAKEIYGLVYGLDLDMYITATKNLQVYLGLSAGNQKSASVSVGAGTGFNWFLPVL